MYKDCGRTTLITLLYITCAYIIGFVRVECFRLQPPTQQGYCRQLTILFVWTMNGLPTNNRGRWPIYDGPDRHLFWSTPELCAGQFCLSRHRATRRKQNQTRPKPSLIKNIFLTSEPTRRNQPQLPTKWIPFAKELDPTRSANVWTTVT